jgi:hypothetical protein
MMKILNPLCTKRHSARGSFLTGCLIALAVVVVLFVVGGVFVWTQWRGWTATGVVAVAEQVIEASELAEDQKQQIMGEIESLATDFKNKDITLEQLVEVGSAIGESPLLPVVAVMAAESRYVEGSGLTDEEKADARLQLQRLARGVYEDKITPDEAASAADEIMVRTNDNYQLADPETVDDEDLRQLTAELKAAADKANIPNEPFEIDIAAEFKKAIDEALGRVSSGDQLPAGGEGGGG